MQMFDFGSKKKKKKLQHTIVSFQAMDNFSSSKHTTDTEMGKINCSSCRDWVTAYWSCFAKIHWAILLAYLVKSYSKNLRCLLMDLINKTISVDAML